MDIQIRRNTSIQFNVLQTDKNMESLKKLFEDVPKLTDEEKKVQEEYFRKREELERQIWAYLEQHPHNDLDGDLITEETHEIEFDVECEEIDGRAWAVAKQIYVQPKKSIYDKKED